MSKVLFLHSYLIFGASFSVLLSTYTLPRGLGRLSKISVFLAACHTKAKWRKMFTSNGKKYEICGNKIAERPMVLLAINMRVSLGLECKCVSVECIYECVLFKWTNSKTHTHTHWHLGNIDGRCWCSNQKTLTRCVPLRRCVTPCMHMFVCVSNFSIKQKPQPATTKYANISPQRDTHSTHSCCHRSSPAA